MFTLKRGLQEMTCLSLGASRRAPLPADLWVRLCRAGKALVRRTFTQRITLLLFTRTGFSGLTSLVCMAFRLHLQCHLGYNRSRGHDRD